MNYMGKDQILFEPEGSKGPRRRRILLGSPIQDGDRVVIIEDVTIRQID